MKIKKMLTAALVTHSAEPLQKQETLNRSSSATVQSTESVEPMPPYGHRTSRTSRITDSKTAKPTQHYEQPTGQTQATLWALNQPNLATLRPLNQPNLEKLWATKPIEITP